MKCLSCKHLDLKHNAQMSRYGFGHCKKEERSCAHFSVSYDRQCKKFEEADQATAIKRAAWIDKQSGA